MRVVNKVRIYPNSAQRLHLAKTFGCCRWFYNYCLQKHNEVYKETGKGLSRFDYAKMARPLKKEHPWLKECYAQTLLGPCEHLSRAFRSFFEKRGGYPSFKKKHERQSASWPQNVKIASNKKINIPSIGLVNMRGWRGYTGKIKTVTVSQESTGRYYASILIETDLPTPKPNHEGNIEGIDLGITTLVATSSGSKYHPRPNISDEKNIKRKQQKLSRKTKGSNKRAKAKRLVARAFEKARRKKHDFLHKLSRKLVDENQVLAFEDLHVKGMMKNHCLARAIGDRSFGTLLTYCKYKAEQLGKAVITVDRFFPSTKTCSNCLYVMDKIPLHIRTWTCPSCKKHHDRDINAAQNVADEAKRLLASGQGATARGGCVRPGRKKAFGQATACEAGTSKCAS